MWTGLKPLDFKAKSDIFIGGQVFNNIVDEHWLWCGQEWKVRDAPFSLPAVIVRFDPNLIPARMLCYYLTPTRGA